MAACEFFIPALHHFSWLCNNGIILFWIILVNLLLCSARLESNCQGDIQRQEEYAFFSAAIVISSSHCIASHIHSEATILNIAIHSQQETLICTLNQQGFLAVAQVVLSFLLLHLIYTF
jgi:hypothetical protein